MVYALDCRVFSFEHLGVLDILSWVGKDIHHQQNRGLMGQGSDSSCKSVLQPEPRFQNVVVQVVMAMRVLDHNAVCQPCEQWAHKLSLFRNKCKLWILVEILLKIEGLVAGHPVCVSVYVNMCLRRRAGFNWGGKHHPIVVYNDMVWGIGIPLYASNNGGHLHWKGDQKREVEKKTRIVHTF